jgi:hypothetical protein
LLSAYLLDRRLFLSGPCRRLLPHSRWRWVTGSPFHRIYFLRGIDRISQFTASSLPCAPRSTTPSGASASRPLFFRGGRCCLQTFRSPGHPRYTIFEADSAAHTLACLRINEPVTRNAARLASGLPGSALAGWGSHPLDDSSDFVELSSPPFCIGPAGTGRIRNSRLLPCKSIPQYSFIKASSWHVVRFHS